MRIKRPSVQVQVNTTITFEIKRHILAPIITVVEKYTRLGSFVFMIYFHTSICSICKQHLGEVHVDSDVRDVYSSINAFGDLGHGMRPISKFVHVDD